MPKTPKYALERWPATDRAAWEAATSTDVSLFERGACAGWSPETKRQAFYAYSRWLAFLGKRDPAALAAAPLDRLTDERLAAFVQRLARGSKGKAVTAQTMASTINHWVNALRAIAPTYTPEWLRQTQRRYQHKIKPRNKRERMVPPEDLYALGVELMDQAAGIADAREGARTFRDGLIIAVLVSSNLRRKNLAALAFGRDVHQVGASYQIAIDAEATKTGKRIDHPLPEELTPYVDAYLHQYRPRFAGATKYDELWLSSKGGVLCKETVWDAVRRRTRVVFGRAVNLHLVRTMTATSAPQLGSPVLGHSKATLTDACYRCSDPLAASRKLAALITALRAQAAMAKPRERAQLAPERAVSPSMRNEIEEVTA